MPVKVFVAARARVTQGWRAKIANAATSNPSRVDVATRRGGRTDKAIIRPNVIADSVIPTSTPATHGFPAVMWALN